jgi:hypothetical protein
MAGLNLLTLNLVLLISAHPTGEDPPAGTAATGTITPALDRCTLEVGGRTIKPARPPALRPQLDRAGGFMIVVEESVIRAFPDGDETPRWTASAPKDVRLAWRAADDQVVYLSGFVADKAGGFRPEQPAKVRRLDARSGKWLTDLPVTGTPGPKQTEHVEAVLLGDGRVFVLTASEDPDEGRGARLAGYRVTAFKTGADKSAWARSFPSAGELEQPGVMLLWAARSPDRTHPDVRPLVRLGGDVLVCAGPVQDLLCLAGDTGETRWRVPRVWEYERGFIGPSVWQHTIGRDGDEPGEKAKGAKDGAGRRFAIVGGPVVVEAPKTDTRGGPSVFVAVSKGPARYAEYLSECVVYELGREGTPAALVTLPRMVRGGLARAVPGGVVWACQGGGFVKLVPTRDRDAGFGLGPGGPDRLCRVAWYREMSAEDPPAWLTADPAGDPVAFADSVAVWVSGGGYVPDRTAGVYHFPLAMIDLATGVDQAMVLKVPYSGTLPEPTTNYGQSVGPGGAVRWHKLGPYVLAVTGLQMDGSRVQVTLGMEKWSRTLSFELAEPATRK